MNPQLFSWTIIGVAALLLALSVVILARLRWSQTRPMKVCIVLSVFAHLLLLAAFYFSRVFDLPFIPGGDQSIVVHLTFEDEAQPAARDEETSAPPAPTLEDAPAPSLTPEPEPEPEPEPIDPDPLPLEPEPTSKADLEEPQQEPPRLDLASRPLELARPEPEQAEPPTTPIDEAPPLVSPPPDAALSDAAEPMVAPAETPPAPLLETAPVDDLPVADAGADPQFDPSPPVTEQNLPEQDARRVAQPRQQVPARYRDRIERPSQRELERRGGNPRTEAAVEAALDWLAGVQQPDGSWNAAQQGGGRGGWVEGQNRGTTGLKADTGITGLALLSFLGAGHTTKRGSYRDNVDGAIEYLLSKQDHLGSLGGNASIYARMYCHGIATLSLCEAAAICGDDTVQAAAQRAIDYTVGSQHRQTGGWRYSPGDRGDTSQFGWQLMALVSAREADLNVPAQIDVTLKRFLHSVQNGNHGGLASYRPGHAPSRSMTAEALACRVFLSSRSPLRDREAAEYISSLRPGRGQRNFYYWYYGTVALSQLNNEYWPAWNRALQKQLLPTQRRHGQMAGSWNPNTVWGGCGGRVYSTALATLCLESYYRYAPARAEESPRFENSRPPVADGWSTRAERR